MIFYIYGMRLRGYSPGCQPKDGLVMRLDDRTGKYHDKLSYNRRLTEKEERDYELDYLGELPGVLLQHPAEVDHEDRIG